MGIEIPSHGSPAKNTKNNKKNVAAHRLSNEPWTSRDITRNKSHRWPFFHGRPQDIYTGCKPRNRSYHIFLLRVDNHATVSK